MNIWQWVGEFKRSLQGTEHEGLIELMDEMSHQTCNDNHAKVDAIYPQALNAARRQGNPWAEIFVRHWYLQSQVLHRSNGLGMLSEAVDLLEFSNRDHTRDCPQSICVVQDVADCYMATDGPGYFDEICAVCDETIARINPAWPCYECITEEHLLALNCTGQYQAALDLADKREALIVSQSNNSHTLNPFAIQQTVAMLGLGQYDRALKLISAARNWAAGLSFVRNKNTLTALCHAYLGDYAKAQEVAISFDEAFTSQGHFVYYCELKYRLALAKAIQNDSDLNKQFNAMVGKMLDSGAIRSTIKLCHWQAELAILREDLFTLERCIATIESIIDKLNKDLGAKAQLELLKQRQIGLREQLAPIPLDELQSLLQNKQTLSLSQLQLARENYADNPLVVAAFVEALGHNGYFEQVNVLVAEQLERYGLQMDLFIRYGWLLLDNQRFETFDAFFAKLALNELKPAQRQQALYFLVRRYFDIEPQKALSFAQQFLGNEPNSTLVLYTAAQLSTRLEQYQQAVAYYLKAIDIEDEDCQGYWWDLMVPATLIEDWSTVRMASLALEMELPGEGPIDVNMGRIRIQLDNIDENIVYAIRRGPVHAMVTTVFDIYEEQFLDDIVVFDPQPLNQLNQQDEDGESCDSEGEYTYLFKAVKTVKKANYFYFTIDGIHPGEEGWQSLSNGLLELGLQYCHMSDEHYHLSNGEPDSDETLMAIYIVVATPADQDLAQLKTQLLELTKGFEHPLLFKELAEKLDCAEFTEQQLNIAQRYGI